MSIGPTGLGKHVVNVIQPAGVQQFQGITQQAVFASPGIGEDEVEALPAKRTQKIISINANNCQPGVSAEVIPEDGRQGFVVVNGGE